MLGCVQWPVRQQGDNNQQCQLWPSSFTPACFANNENNSVQIPRQFHLQGLLPGAVALRRTCCMCCSTPASARRALHVQADLLDRRSLQKINAYNPGLSAAWMLQRAMSVRPDEKDIPADLVNRMLASNFQAMASSGDSVMRPFLQDVMKFWPFTRTVMGQMARDPLFIPQLLKHVGPLAMLDWLKNHIMLGLYELFYVLFRPLRQKADSGAWDEKTRFRIKRWVDALQYGSGRDH